MKVKVVDEKCIGCGSCIAITPDVFEYNDEGLATVKIEEIPDDLIEATEDALNSCPVGAIEEADEEK